MPQDKMMQSIGRIERALVRLENIDLSRSAEAGDLADLQQRHECLKREAQTSLVDIERLLSQVKG
jgi:hypothetical protein